MAWGNLLLWVRITQVLKSAVLPTVFLSGRFPYEPPVVRNCPALTNRLWVCRIPQELPFAATVPPSSRKKSERKQFCGTESYLSSEATIHLKSRERITNIWCKIFLLNTKMHPSAVKSASQISNSRSQNLPSPDCSFEVLPTARACTPQQWVPSHTHTSKRGHLGQQRWCCLGQLLSTSPNHLPLPAVLEVTVPQWGYLTE